MRGADCGVWLCYGEGGVGDCWSVGCVVAGTLGPGSSFQKVVFLSPASSECRDDYDVIQCSALNQQLSGVR